MAKKKITAKKILSVVGTVLSVLLFVLAAFIIIKIIVAKTQGKAVDLFGYSFAIVVTDSMEPDIMVGDMIVYRSCDISDVQVGDYIVFIGGEHFNAAAGKSVVHMAYEIEVNADGEIEITTKGINNASQDRDSVTAENLLGICIYNSSGWGSFLTFMSKYGIFILILVVAVPVIVVQTVKIVKLAKGKGTEEERLSAHSLPETDGQDANLPAGQEKACDQAEISEKRSDLPDGATENEQNSFGVNSETGGAGDNSKQAERSEDDQTK